MYQVEVLIEHGRLINSFSYLSEEALPLFVRVKVPFNKQEIVALVVDCCLAEASERPLLYIKERLDEQAILNDELSALGQWMADYYLTSTIKVIQTMLPSAFNVSSGSQKPQEVVFVEFVKMVELRGAKQQAALDFLQGQKKMLRIAFNREFPGVLALLVAKGACRLFSEEKAYQTQTGAAESDFPLSEKQQEVYEVLCGQKQHVVNLLFGITGSGKSEIYLQLSKQWIKAGKQVLILVPEISLTPQMIALFRSRLGSDIAIYHSRLSQQQRYEQYQLVKEKRVQVVVGTRSAVFLPFDNLGGIVIDEEHDDSYKQDKLPKYHTRDVAIWRAKYHDCPLVLASATPALESYARALKGVYQLLVLDRRINGELPEIKLVDMNQELRKNQQLIISQTLAQAIAATLQKNQQVIILLNRRGYTPLVKCQSCQYVVLCDNCDIAMVYHKNDGVLRCHTCGLTKSFPKVCPQCQGNNFLDIGYGTQKLVEELQKLFSTAKILRMDKDSTRSKAASESILQAFGNHQADILVGTQMIAKGLDFPGVSLVGILNSDALLNRLDYRAQESTFALLTQASGRAGRQIKQSQVIIQACQTQHYVLQQVQQHNYRAFFNQEMKYRKLTAYPPYQYLVLLTLSALDSEKIKPVMLALKQELLAEGITVLGPAELLRRNRLQALRLTLKGKDLTLMQSILRQVLPAYQKYAIVTDVNPSHTEV